MATSGSRDFYTHCPVSHCTHPRRMHAVLYEVLTAATTSSEKVLVQCQINATDQDID